MANRIFWFDSPVEFKNRFRKEGYLLKKALICVLVLVLLFTVVGCGTISGEKAISIALADLGIDRVGTASNKAILNKDDDPMTYKVILNMNSYYENYIINAKTGEIISHETVGN